VFVIYFCRSEAISLIEEQTGIGRNSQLILQQEALWKDIGKYPSTSVDNPLFLFNRENNNIQYTKENGICKILRSELLQLIFFFRSLEVSQL